MHDHTSEQLFSMTRHSSLRTMSGGPTLHGRLGFNVSFPGDVVRNPTSCSQHNYIATSLQHSQNKNFVYTSVMFLHSFRGNVVCKPTFGGPFPLKISQYNTATSLQHHEKIPVIAKIEHQKLTKQAFQHI